MWSGYEVTYVQNITDVDDKIINRAYEEERSAAEVASEYTEAFIDAMHALGVADPTIRPRATEEIPAMVDLITCLIEGGHAYEIEGDVYFSVRSFPSYGCLSGRDIDSMRSGARVEVDLRKQDPLDFALWKAAKPGEPSWPSPWGQGRPGWHIECSAMSARYLGSPFDIHAGGDDLTFPHHENEIAQSEACFETGFANYWIHGGMLTIDREKMSKSEGNFLLLKDVLEYVRPEALRLLMLQTHYRSPFDYSAERLDEATAALERIEAAIRNLCWAVENPTPLDTTSTGSNGSALDPDVVGSNGNGSDPDVAGSNGSAVDPDAIGLSPLKDAENITANTLRIQIATTREQFKISMDDDFNTAGAVAGIYDLVSAGNLSITNGVSGTEQAKVVSEAADTIIELIGVLGIALDDGSADEGDLPSELVELAARLAQYTGDSASEALNELIKARQAARTSKDWPTADAVRDGLATLDITIEDTPQGPRVIRS